MHRKLKPALQGFDMIKRYWDNGISSILAKVLPGEYYVTKHNEAITTILGSCISACIRDVKSHVGGINHFMLPIDQGDTSWAKDSQNKATRYGNFAMEHLINDILKNGGNRKNLEVKLFGGGAVLAGFQHCNIGDKNIQFVYRYLSSEGMSVASQDVGGTYARKIIYYPATGAVMMKKIISSDAENIVAEEDRYFNNIKEQSIDGDVELFD